MIDSRRQFALVQLSCSLGEKGGVSIRIQGKSGTEAYKKIRGDRNVENNSIDRLSQKENGIDVTMHRHT